MVLWEHKILFLGTTNFLFAIRNETVFIEKDNVKLKEPMFMSIKYTIRYIKRFFYIKFSAFHILGALVILSEIFEKILGKE